MELEENRIREEDYGVRSKQIDSVSDIERYISNEIDWVINHIRDVEINIRYYEEKHRIVE